MKKIKKSNIKDIKKENKNFLGNFPQNATISIVGGLIWKRV